MDVKDRDLDGVKHLIWQLDIDAHKLYNQMDRLMSMFDEMILRAEETPKKNDEH